MNRPTMKLTSMLGAIALALLLAACGSSEAGSPAATPVVVDSNATATAQLVLDDVPD